jgi:RNA-directed DNA polymerase
LLNRKTRCDRMRAKLRELKEALRRRMHTPTPNRGRWLKSVVSGFYAYHAVPTNFRSLNAFRYHVTKLWLRALRRRSQKSVMTWERMNAIAAYWLPRPKILHPWPQQRFAVKPLRVGEPYAGILHVRICAGGTQ